MQTKEKIRGLAKERRDSLEEGLRREHASAAALKAAGLEWFRNSRQILIYLAVGSEMDTQPLARLAWAAGKDVFAPVVDVKNKSMSFYRFMEGEALKTGDFGVRTPPAVASRKVDLGRPCLIVCPCLGFDRQLGRIGYGAGFYDRFLAGPARAWKRLALAYGVQEMEALPLEEHDQRMHAVVTEKEVLLA